MNRIGNETFAESIDGYSVDDVAYYIEKGYEGPKRKEQWRGLYRLHYYPQSMSVHWELLASLNGRLLQMEQAGNGERVGVFGVRGRDGHPFIMRLREKDFQNTREITKAVALAGGAGTFIMPGCARAVMRAILEFSKEGEPMPNDTREMETLYANWPEEIDPFADDDGIYDPWNYPIEP